MVRCIRMLLRDDSVIIANPATREASMKSSWQTDTGTLACHWSEAGQQVRYNSAWMQEASNIQGSYLQPLPGVVGFEILHASQVVEHTGEMQFAVAG